VANGGGTSTCGGRFADPRCQTLLPNAACRSRCCNSFHTRGFRPPADPPASNRSLHVRGSPSDHQRPLQIQRLVHTMMLHLNTGVQKINPNTVFVQVRFIEQALPQEHPLRRTEHALEDRLLDALPVVLARPRHAPQTTLASRRHCGDVVGDEQFHVALPPSPD